MCHGHGRDVLSRPGVFPPARLPPGVAVDNEAEERLGEVEMTAGVEV